jgi:hypothetical protein
MAAISLLMSRVIVDELRKLGARQRDGEAADADTSASRLPHRRCSLAVEHHVHLIQLFLMVKLGMDCQTWTSRCCGFHGIQIHTEHGYAERLNQVSSGLLAAKLERMPIRLRPARRKGVATRVAYTQKLLLVSTTRSRT